MPDVRGPLGPRGRARAPPPRASGMSLHGLGRVVRTAPAAGEPLAPGTVGRRCGPNESGRCAMALTWSELLDELRRADLLVSAPPEGPAPVGADRGQPVGRPGRGVPRGARLAGRRSSLRRRRGPAGRDGRRGRGALGIGGAGDRGARRPPRGTACWRPPGSAIPRGGSPWSASPAPTGRRRRPD